MHYSWRTVLYFIYFVTEMQVLGRIDASSNSVPRQIPYKVTYTRANQQLLIEAQKMQAPGYEDSRLTCTINRAKGLKLQFGQGKLQYQVSAAGEVQDQGKTLRLQLKWTEVKSEVKSWASVIGQQNEIKGWYPEGDKFQYEVSRKLRT